MYTPTAQEVAKLRAKTDAPMMKCKEALVKSEGNFDKAVDLLRIESEKTAAKKSDRIAAEGIVGSYIHMGGKIGVIVEVNCETDFVSRGERFQTLVKDIAMHIAASNPLFVTVAEVDAESVNKEKEIFRAQAVKEGKPENIVEKMVEGRVRKYYQDVVLYEQAFVKDPSKTITQIINEAVAQIGEKITIRRFARFEMGEGLTKRSENFAEEIAKQTQKKD